MYPDYEFGKGDTCPIDQMPAKDFNLDPYTGRPTEEITKVMRAQTAAEQQTAFMNLAQYKGDFLPADVSPRDALKYMKPHLCQLPSELADWQDSFTEYQLKEHEKALKDAELKKLQDEIDELRNPSSSSAIDGSNSD